MIHNTEWRIIIMQALLDCKTINASGIKNLKDSIYKPINMHDANIDTRKRTNNKVNGIKVLED